MLERMKDASSVLIKERQRVLNISSVGVAIELQNEELIKMMPERKNVVFDIIFRKQAPLRFQAEICHIERVNGSIVAGLSFLGVGHTESSRGNVQRLQSYLKTASGS